MILIHALALVLQIADGTDTPIDLSTYAGTIGTVFSGLAPALGLVLAAGLAIAGVIWGVPKLVKFFKKVSA